jgi:hypothetical protein
LEIVVELSQFLGFTQGGGDPPVFGGAPILKSLIKNRERATNPNSASLLAPLLNELVHTISQLVQNFGPLISQDEYGTICCARAAADFP